MRVRLWGVRGSLATPMSNAQLREKARALLAEANPEDLASPATIEAYQRALKLTQAQHAAGVFGA